MTNLREQQEAEIRIDTYGYVAYVEEAEENQAQYIALQEIFSQINAEVKQ